MALCALLWNFVFWSEFRIAEFRIATTFKSKSEGLSFYWGPSYLKPMPYYSCTDYLGSDDIVEDQMYGEVEQSGPRFSNEIRNISRLHSFAATNTGSLISHSQATVHLHSCADIIKESVSMLLSEPEHLPPSIYFGTLSLDSSISDCIIFLCAILILNKTFPLIWLKPTWAIDFLSLIAQPRMLPWENLNMYDHMEMYGEVEDGSYSKHSSFLSLFRKLSERVLVIR